MRFRHYTRHEALPNTEAWQARRGFWSFLILHEKVSDALYYTSYRDQREAVNTAIDKGKAVIFFGDQEYRHTTVSKELGYSTVDDAMRACEAKYKELLLR